MGPGLYYSTLFSAQMRLRTARKWLIFSGSGIRGLCTILVQSTIRRLEVTTSHTRATPEPVTQLIDFEMYIRYFL